MLSYLALRHAEHGEDQKNKRKCFIGLSQIAPVLIGALALLGCVNIPVSDQVIARRDAKTVRTDAAACAKRWLDLTAGAQRSAALDSAGFRLMTWNVYKARAKHWSDEFTRLITGQDLVLLQEAYLTPPFRAVLEQSRFAWSMARAFDYNGAETGVLTAGRASASGACVSRVAEPFIRTPKSALLTRYPLVGSDEDLWVANLHGINFTLGTVRFRGQLEALAGVLASHNGPMILAGDFNDWSERRSDILRRITGRLGLEPLTLTKDARSRHWGSPVDHVFYRGLEVVEADSVEVSSSDHNPVRVTFKVP